MIDVEKVKEIAYAEAMRLVEDGVPFDQAVEWATDLAIKKVRRGSLGEVKIIENVETLALKGKEIATPFLWILSIISFGMAVMNADRIAKMYGSWKAGRAAIKRGTPPGD